MLQEEGHRKRLREKFRRSGHGALLDYELLELILTYAIPRRDVKPVAKRLLERFRSFPAVMDAPEDKLIEVEGVGENSALLIKLMRSACVRYLEQDIRARTYMGRAEDFCDYARMRLGERNDEAMMAFYLNTKNYLIDAEVLSEGATDRVNVFPSVIAKKALLHGARSVVICHNHPSGLVKPSKQDDMVTLDIRRALAPLNIFLLDHIIVSYCDSYSYRANEGKSGRFLLDPLAKNGAIP